jgi:hypothetical protein
MVLSLNPGQPSPGFPPPPFLCLACWGAGYPVAIAVADFAGLARSTREDPEPQLPVLVYGQIDCHHCLLTGALIVSL